VRYWLRVVCRDHVRRATSGGIAQLEAHEGTFHPWCRRVDYVGGAMETPIRSLALDLTAQPNWGYQLRRGLVELSEHDFTEIRAAMAGGR
jgi:hypothetical protein